MAYQMAREHSNKAHDTNKRYYDRRARERMFNPGEYVFLYSPVIKPGRSSKFRRCWSGPWKILRRKSDQTYAIENKQGKEMTVHVNRLKTAYNVEGWESGTKQRQPKRPKRPDTVTEDEELELVLLDPILVDPEVEHPPPQETPVRERGEDMDTPSPQAPPTDHRADPTFVPDGTPHLTRATPPLTRARRRMQMLPEVPEEEPDD